MQSGPTMDDVRAVTPQQLTAMTPPQIDALNAVLYEEYARLDARLQQAWERFFRALGEEKVRRGRRWVWPLGRDEAQAKARALLDSPPPKVPQEIARYSPGMTVPQYVEQVRQALDAVGTVRREVEGLDSGPNSRLVHEWERRGGWTRAFLAQSSDGHVHKSMGCSTCNRGGVPTRFAWMIEYSGKREAEIVEAAGERACTVCYPSAPVNVLKRPTKMFSPDEIAAQRAREEREAKRAAAAAKKAAKAITNPDGTPLEVFDRRSPERHIQTSGGIKVVPARDHFETLSTLAAARSWLADRFESWRSGAGSHRDIPRVAEAIAHKEGKTADQVIEEAKKRAARRR